MALEDYNSTAVSNTSLAGLSLQEGQTQTKFLNNHLRELMADVKDGTAIRVPDVATVQAWDFSASTGLRQKTVIVDKVGLFYYDSADNSTADDGATVLVTQSDERYKIFGSLAPVVPNSQASTELTISSGSVTPTGFAHAIDTESDAASDDLDTIAATNFSAGNLLMVWAQNASRTVVLKDGTGNIQLPGNNDISLDDAEKTVLLRYNGSNWIWVAGTGGSGSSVDDTVINQNAATELTLSTGAIVPTRGVHTVDTEADASSDDLDTITATNFSAGGVLFLNAVHADRTVVLKHATGNILLPNDQDISLDDTEKTVVLRYDGSNWNFVTSFVRPTVPNTAATSELTIASGAIVPTGFSHSVDTESDAATDDLVTITATNYRSGDLLMLRAEAAAHVVTVKHGSGNILLPADQDVVLNDTEKTLLLRYDGTNWNYVAGATLSAVASLSALTAISTTSSFNDGDRLFVDDSLRGGWFVWDGSDLSTEVGYETTASNNHALVGAYYAPDGENGSAGAWVRLDYLAGHPWKWEWFGATGDATTDDKAAIQAAIDFAASVHGTNWRTVGEIRFEGRSAADYNIGSAVTIAETFDNLTIVGGLFSSDANGVMFHVGSDLSGGGDTTSANPIRSVTFSNVMFRCDDLDSTASVAIQANRATALQVTNCEFMDWWTAIAAYRMNTPIIHGCIFHNTQRTTNNAEAFITLNGVFDSASPSSSTPGGGHHISHCEFQGQAGNQTNGILVKACDGLYVAHCHFIGCTNGIHTNPDGTQQSSNRIISAEFIGCYIDAPNTNGVGVLIAGSVDDDGVTTELGADNGLYERITIMGGEIRGNGVGGTGIVIGVTDAGSFESNGGALKDIKIIGVKIWQWNTGIVCNGKATASTNIEPLGLDIVGCTFEENATDSSATSDINIDFRSAKVIGCTFSAADNAPTRACDFDQRTTLTGDSGDSALLMAGCDFTNSNYSTEPYRRLTDSGELYKIEGNLYPSGDEAYDIGSHETHETWTPVFTFATPGDLSLTYTRQQGEIYRILNRIDYYFEIISDGNISHTTASGDAKITGLPESPSGNITNVVFHVYVIGTGYTWPTSTTMLTGRINASGELFIQSTGSGVGSTTWGVSHITNGIPINIRGWGTMVRA